MITIRPAPVAFRSAIGPHSSAARSGRGRRARRGEAKPVGQWAGTRGERGGAAHQPSPSARGRARGGASRRALEAGDRAEQERPVSPRPWLLRRRHRRRGPLSASWRWAKVCECAGEEPSQARPKSAAPAPRSPLERGAPCRGGGERRAGRGGGRAPCSPGGASAGCSPYCEAAGSSGRRTLPSSRLGAAGALALRLALGPR